LRSRFDVRQCTCVIGQDAARDLLLHGRGVWFHAEICIHETEGGKVPRIATTVASWVLMACAIGVNIARYPGVSAMVKNASDPAQSVGVPSPAEPAEPIPQPLLNGTAKAGPRLPIVEAEKRPLAAPVVSAGLSAAAAAPKETVNNVRRLPPVDRVEPADSREPPPADGAIPFYPATRTP
jgi:hypothetical protein